MHPPMARSFIPRACRATRDIWSPARPRIHTGYRISLNCKLRRREKSVAVTRERRHAAIEWFNPVDSTSQGDLCRVCDLSACPLEIRKQCLERGSVLRFVSSALRLHEELKLRDTLKLRESGFESLRSLRISLIFDENEDTYTPI